GNARVDPRQQLALLHLVAGLHRLLEDLARRLGLDAQGEDRLDHAGGGCRYDDVAVLHGNLLVQGGRLRLATGGAVHDARRQRPAHEQLDPVHRDPPLCRRPGSPPPVTFWNRCLNCSGVTPGGSVTVRPFGSVRVCAPPPPPPPAPSAAAAVSRPAGPALSAAWAAASCCATVSESSPSRPAAEPTSRGVRSAALGTASTPCR